MSTSHTTTLGELITVLYDEFLAMYGDEELASVAVAATINDLLTTEAGVETTRGRESAAADAA